DESKAEAQVGAQSTTSDHCIRLVRAPMSAVLLYQIYGCRSIHGVLSPNAPAHRRRANGVRLSTETRSRRSVQPVCWTIKSCLFPSHLCLFAEQNSSKVTPTPNPSRTLVACAVPHSNVVNNLITTVRPPLEWPCANHVAFPKTQNLKSSL